MQRVDTEEIALTTAAAAVGLAAPMFVMILVRRSWQVGKTASTRS
jgi:hypothetical protein